jgi:hypothetical protein
MTAFNPPSPTAYAAVPGPINSATLAPIVDANDNISPSVATPDLVSPLASSGGYIAQTMPILSAILVELRVIATLLQSNSAPTLDLSALRSDEASGATGGVLQ